MNRKPNVMKDLLGVKGMDGGQRQSMEALPGKGLDLFICI